MTTNLEYFEGIIPCGHVERRPTSVEVLSGRQIATDRTAIEYARHFAKTFGAILDWVPAQEILSLPTATA